MSNDSWKDMFVLREYITGLEFLALPSEQQEWLKKYNKIFVTPLNEDRIINLLHPKNVKFKPKNKV